MFCILQAKLAEEKENRQKKKLIQRSRMEDAGTVEGGLASWRHHLETSKTLKKLNIEAEIESEMVCPVCFSHELDSTYFLRPCPCLSHKEKIELMALDMAARLNIWNAVVADHQVQTLNRHEQFDQAR
jgi:hypothetical protein